MRLEDLKNKKILIVGYGIEGKATEAFLKEMVPSAKITIVDQATDKDYLSAQSTYDIAIKSPHVPSSLLTIPFTTATNLFFSTVLGITIGITGTKGKSTTTSLIGAILNQAGKKVHIVGNIGVPMLTELLKSNTKEDVWVIELSSYQLVDIQYSPHISVMLSLFPEHMDFHGTTEKYYLAKSTIVKFATPQDYFVYNPAFPEIEVIASKTKAQKVSIAPLPFPRELLSLLGEHNTTNAQAAVAVARILHIPQEDIEEATKNFKGLRHRLQNVGTFQDVTFYDDAISTTPHSTIAALEALPRVGTLLLGGLDRGYDFTILVHKLLEYKIPNLVLFPESGKKIRVLLEKQTDYTPHILETDSMKEAVSFAFAHTPKGTICLLSTASPSYTIWKNFEEKGDTFQKWAKELGSQSA